MPFFDALSCDKITAHGGVWKTSATHQYESSHLGCAAIDAVVENELGLIHLKHRRPRDPRRMDGMDRDDFLTAARPTTEPSSHSLGQEHPVFWTVRLGPPLAVCGASPRSHFWIWCLRSVIGHFATLPFRHSPFRHYPLPIRHSQLPIRRCLYQIATTAAPIRHDRQGNFMWYIWHKSFSIYP